MSYLFVYGTLKKRQLADKVLKRNLKESPYTLDGYKKVHVPGKAEDEFTIIDDPLEYVNGDLIEVNQDEMSLCDEWEDEYYRAIVKTYNGKGVYAYFYVGKDK